MAVSDQNGLMINSGAEEYPMPRRFQQRAQPPGDPNSLRDILRAAGQGLSYNWLDRGEAGVRSLLGQGDRESILKRIQKEYAEFSKENPWTTNILEFGGAVAGPLALAVNPLTRRMGMNLMQRTLGGTGPVAQLVSRAGLGGTGAALSYAGSQPPETPGDVTAADALMVAPIGAAANAFFPPLVKGSANLLREAKNLVSWSPPAATNTAAGKINRALETNRKTPQDVESEWMARNEIGVPSYIATADPSLVDMTAALVRKDNRARVIIEPPLTAVQSDAKRRVLGQVDEGLRIGDGMAATEGALTDFFKNEATPLYNAAYNVKPGVARIVDDPRIVNMLDLDTLKDVWPHAQKMVNAERDAARASAVRTGDVFDPTPFDLSDIYKTQGGKLVPTGQRPTVATVDAIKRALDDVTRTLSASANAAERTTGKQIGRVRTDFRHVAKESVPEYATALNAYAGNAQVLDALELGYKNFSNMKFEAVRSTMDNLGTQSEKLAFRQGVARRYYDQIATPKDLNAAKFFVGEQDLKKMEVLFDNTGQFNLFKAVMQREAQLFADSAAVLAAAKAGRRRAAGADLDDDPIQALHTVFGGWRSSLMGAANTVISRTRMNSATAERLAEMLLSKDPTEVAAVVKALTGEAAARAARNERSMRGASATVRGISAAIPDAGVDIGIENEEGQDPDAYDKRLQERFSIEAEMAEDDKRAAEANERAAYH